MHISRVQVTEGFLDGLDMRLLPGLNVVIGARGTGKTSIVELIRYCLDVPGHTTDTTKRSREHALSILGSGEVSVTLSDGNYELIVRRSAGSAAQTLGTAPTPIVFSQTEIETIGLQSSGRLRLIDGFTSSVRETYLQEEAVSSSVYSITAQIESAQRELDQLAREMADMPRLDAELAQLAPAERELQALSSTTALKTTTLAELSKTISAYSVRSEALTRDIDELAGWKALIMAAIDHTPSLTQLQDRPDLTRLMQSAVSGLARSYEDARGLQALLETTREENETARISVDGQARVLRQDVERLKAGSGEIVSNGMRLRERKAQLIAIGEFFHTRREAMNKLILRRASLLNELDGIRDQRFSERRKIADFLSAALGPRIRVGIKKAGRVAGYASAIAEALKGSGIRYNELALSVAENISPRELTTIVESGDTVQLSQILSIGSERASRLLVALKNSGSAALATSLVEDEVELELLDGKIYKDISDISTGQRCTTILPIVLQHAHRVVVIDQPEDHIDNAFIADTLVRAILKRPEGSQLIVSTHNANIPVLGNANTVTQLESDGRRGFIAASGRLDDDPIVRSISAVMEGGREAFARRAAFYQEHEK